MKKIMLALAFAAIATVSEASAVSWTVSSGNAYGVDINSVIGNGNYAAATTKAKGNTDFTYALLVFDGDGNQVGSSSGAMKYGSTGKISLSNLEIGGNLVGGVDYTYEITVKGTQSSLSSKADTTVDDVIYSYSGAQLEAVLTGTLTGKTSGAALISDNITSWKVTGITETPVTPPGPEPVPEPTSALLLVCGAAGLMLRRRV